MNAFSFCAIPLEAIPLETAYVSTLPQQEVPDYFAGPATSARIAAFHSSCSGPKTTFASCLRVFALDYGNQPAERNTGENSKLQNLEVQVEMGWLACNYDCDSHGKGVTM